MKTRLVGYIILAIFSTLIIYPGRVCFGEEVHEPYNIPVLVVKYFPVDGKNIDINITGDWGRSLEYTQQKTRRLTQEVIEALEQGSRYHGHKNPSAQPSLKYEVVKEIEFLKPLPTYKKIGHRVPMTDYNAIMEEIDAQEWVEDRGVKEIWIWGYHGGVIDLWESNMAGPFGDISNSDQDKNDLPVFNKTYTVYHYNYQRQTSEAIEDHMHQIERIFNHVNRDLFWHKFVGKVGEGRCGWAHYPPNGLKDYDWKNTQYVDTDIEDWRPEGGKKKSINCQRWDCNSLKWFIFWMQNIPGKGNQITYQGKKLRNWWIFIGDFDYAMQNHYDLVY